MINITTAFYDIGRSDWTGYIDGHPIPGYIKRTNDEYFERFERLLKLENEIVVFTQPKFEDRFKEYQKHKSNLQVFYEENYPLYYMRFLVKECQESMKRKLNIRQPWNPEYWSPDYVLVNMSKASFCNKAISKFQNKENMIAWLDFAYARKNEDVPTTKWEYNFNKEKSHLFTMKPLPENFDLRKTIETNDVTIQGCHIIASPSKWTLLKFWMEDKLWEVIHEDLIDDDQTFWLMLALEHPNSFEIHQADPNDWFNVMRKWNNAI